MLLKSGFKSSDSLFNPYPSRDETNHGFSGTNFQFSPEEFTNDFKLNVEHYDHSSHQDVKPTDPGSFDFILQRLEATMGRNYNECLLRKPEVRSVTSSEPDMSADVSQLILESSDIDIDPYQFVTDDSTDTERKLELLMTAENMPRRVLGRGRARRKSGPAPRL